MRAQKSGVHEGLSDSHLEGCVSGEIKNEAFRIEAAKFLKFSAKASVSSDDMSLESQSSLCLPSAFFNRTFLVCSFSGLNI